MTVKQTEGEHPSIVDSTPIATGWLCAQYAHGKDVPAWLHQTLAQVGQQAGVQRLPILILPMGGQNDSLVVMTLGDFLRWSHRRAACPGNQE